MSRSADRVEEGVVRRGGFTLIELMVVLVVLGILAASIAPSFSGTREEARLRSSAAQLVALMRLASSQSLATNRPCRVRILSENRRYVLETQQDGVEGRAGYQPAEQLPGYSGTLPETIRIRLIDNPERTAPPSKAARFLAATNRGDAVHFYPDGTADARIVELVDRDDFRLQLRVHPTTARIAVRDLGQVSATDKRRGEGQRSDGGKRYR